MLPSQLWIHRRLLGESPRQLLARFDHYWYLKLLTAPNSVPRALFERLQPSYAAISRIQISAKIIMNKTISNEYTTAISRYWQMGRILIRLDLYHLSAGVSTWCRALTSASCRTTISNAHEDPIRCKVVRAETCPGSTCREVTPVS